jgi:hypothetical protein
MLRREHKDPQWVEYNYYALPMASETETEEMKYNV